VGVFELVDVRKSARFLLPGFVSSVLVVAPSDLDLFDGDLETMLDDIHTVVE
jgi:hypothetical protein